MKLALTLALIAWPLIEIAILIEAGRSIGFWPTMGLVVGTAFLGLAIIARNGFDTALRAQRAMQQGELPLAPMVEGALVVVAGVLLVTPGLLADALGLILLVPPLRRLAILRLVRTLFGDTGEAAPSRARGDHSTEARPPPRSGRANGPVIDGEFTRLDDRPAQPDAGKPVRPPNA